MPLVVIAPGPLATIQDLGRFGHRGVGVPASGAFDRRGLVLANALLGNPPGAAAVELTGFGGVFRAEETLAIALAGAPMSARIEPKSGPDRPCSSPGSTTLRPGDRLILGPARHGHRAYLAVRGGWQTPLHLGSRSDEVPLSAGDRLPAEPGTIPDRRLPDDAPRAETVATIRFLDGLDSASCPAPGLDGRAFRLGPLSDRMGLRLEGEPLEVPSDPSRLSMPVAPGTVQVAGGRAIVLGPSCGTMGGYPQVGQVISADLDLLAQLRPGDALRLLRVGLEEARRLDRLAREALADRARIVAVAASDRPVRGGFGGPG